MHKKIVAFILAITAITSNPLIKSVYAQSPDGSWSDYVNISDTPTSSSYPAITADKSGRVHVLWSEDVGGITNNILKNPDGSPSLDMRGNPINYLDKTGNTLYYTQWDGKNWLNPLEINYNTLGDLEYPDAVVDPNGTLHAVWIGSQAENGRLMYSHARASEAHQIQAWSKPAELADTTFALNNPVSIVADSTGGLHIAYSSLGLTPGLLIINSFDGGVTWSKPTCLFSTFDSRGEQEGVSTVRLVVDQSDRLHVTFTRWGKDGNGKAIYYAQSRDHGRTWSAPFEVAAWQPGWYEVDWLNVAAIKDEIHLVWEGGLLAYLNERISTDGGKTWGSAYQILPNLRGENGFSDLVVDSGDQLHLLVVLRGDGATLTHGVWYTTWAQKYWQYPVLLGTHNFSLYSQASRLTSSKLAGLLQGTLTGNGLRYQRSTIVNGNELFVVVVNEWDGEIYASHTTLSSPRIAPSDYPEPAPASILPTTTSSPQPTNLSTPSPILSSNEPGLNLGQEQFNTIMLSAVPSCILLFCIVLFVRRLKR